MFKKRAKSEERAQTPGPHSHVPTSLTDATLSIRKYKRPKILLIDIDESAESAVARAGYNVSAGTFGTPYKVNRGSGYQPVIVEATLPNYTEQEIIVLDLDVGDRRGEPPAEKSVPLEELDWWAKSKSGVIEPRPKAKGQTQKQF